MSFSSSRRTCNAREGSSLQYFLGFQILGLGQYLSPGILKPGKDIRLNLSTRQTHVNIERRVILKTNGSNGSDFLEA